MNLVASSVTAAFYGGIAIAEIKERYTKIESGAEKPLYPRQSGEAVDAEHDGKRKVAEKDAIKEYNVEVT